MTDVRKETMDSLAVSVKPKDWKKDFVYDGCFSRLYRSLQLVNDNKIDNYAAKHVFNWANKCVSELIRARFRHHLPNDIIQEEIMFRLPLKTLMRLKCVCKSWYNFISGDNFRRRYRSLQQANGNAPIGFICGDRVDQNTALHGFCMADQFMYTSESDEEKEELKCFDYLNTFGYVIASSKGLLLVGHDLNTLSVYDLVSKKLVNLPRHNLEGGDLVSLGFKCEESSSSNPHLCYKVVCVDNPGEDHDENRSSHNVEIYSSETGVWQKSIMKSGSSTFQIWSRHTTKVIRGVFYRHQKVSNSFIAYDCEDPKGHAVIIELPNTTNILYRRKLRQLEGRRDGSLQFVGEDMKERVISVWILQAESESGRSYMYEDTVSASNWVLAYRFSLEDATGCYNNFLDSVKNWVRILGVDPVDPHIVYVRVLSQIYAYDYHQGQNAYTWPPAIAFGIDVFVHFEWPTFPCL